MQDPLNRPAVQGGLAPFVASLLAAALFAPIRVPGLAAIAGFVVTVYPVGDFGFDSLAAKRKIVLLGLIAAGTGVCVDLAFEPTHLAGIVPGVLFDTAAP